MKVKFLTPMAGAVMRDPGDVAEVANAEAKRLIAAGYAEAVGGAKSGVETATSKAPKATRAGVTK